MANENFKDPSLPPPEPHGTVLDDLVIEKSEQTDELSLKLQKLGFLNVPFEAKARHRFFVKIAGIPPNLIRSVSRPSYDATTQSWVGHVDIQVYNAIKEDMEKKLLDLVNQGQVRIEILVLNTNAEIITTWDIQASEGKIHFDELSWLGSEINKPDIISVSFKPVSVVITK